MQEPFTSKFIWRVIDFSGDQDKRWLLREELRLFYINHEGTRTIPGEGKRCVRQLWPQEFCMDEFSRQWQRGQWKSTNNGMRKDSAEQGFMRAGRCDTNCWFFGYRLIHGIFRSEVWSNCSGSSNSSLGSALSECRLVRVLAQGFRRRCCGIRYSKCYTAL
jgi:hypothetical protein